MVKQPFLEEKDGHYSKDRPPDENGDVANFSSLPERN